MTAAMTDPRDLLAFFCVIYGACGFVFAGGVLLAIALNRQYFLPLTLIFKRYPLSFLWFVFLRFLGWPYYLNQILNGGMK